MLRFLFVLILGLFAAGRAAATELSIDVWYGSKQTFGHLGGHPQRWVNLLGSVQPAEELQRLSWTLDGGEERPLSFREDQKRIARDGDFNVEIARTELKSGRNVVELIAVSRQGQTVRRQVELDYRAENGAWPLPYEIDWSQVRDIQDAVQVVDGRWRLTDQGIRTQQRYYDRVVALGDPSWRDYEIATTVTVHAVTEPNTGANTTGVTHAAIALRWPGHDADGHQPSVKWYPLGATAEFRLQNRLSECRWRIFDGKRDLGVESDRRRQLEFETPYRMKHRVESLRDGRTRYRAKLWPADGEEPTAWDIERIEPDDVTSGSALLIAHHCDATFGDVTAVPLDEERRSTPK